MRGAERVPLRRLSHPIRNKIDALADKINFLDSGRSEGAASFVGEVYDGGNIPTVGDRFYLVRPVGLDGSAAEGESGTATPDTSRSIPVYMLGPQRMYPGDRVIAYSVGGRWVSRNGGSVDCLPTCQSCPGNKYAVVGSVLDPLHGSVPIRYNFASGGWYSDPLAFFDERVSTYPGPANSGAFEFVPGSDCYIGGTRSGGSGPKSYYVHRLTCETGGKVNASILVSYDQCDNIYDYDTLASIGAGVIYGFFPDSLYLTFLDRTNYNGLIDTFTAVPSVGTPSSCDPITYVADWSASPIGSTFPFTSATYTIPVADPPEDDYVCLLPCPLPKKDLYVSWTGPVGSGGGILTYTDTPDEWTLACNGAGISFRVFVQAPNQMRLSVTKFAASACTGISATTLYPNAIGLSNQVFKYVCEPLEITWTIPFTSAAYMAGYRIFTVTE